MRGSRLSPPSPPLPRLLPALTLIGGVGIAFEILLVRILSIAQWHHFAYMIISVALLGFGVSGTVLGLMAHRVRGHEAGLFRAGTLALALAVTVCYEASQGIPFETLQIVSRPAKQSLALCTLYIVLTVPFFLVSWCIALGFLLRPRGVGRAYFANLIGSGAGAALSVLALHAIPADRLPYALSAVAFGAFWLVAVPERRWLAAGTCALLALSASLATRGFAPVRTSEYKGLSYALRLPQATVVAEAESPLSRITAIRSPLLRETPGQLGGYPMRELGPLPEQIGLFFDGGSVSPVQRWEGNLRRYAYLDYVTPALGYRLVERPEVLVLGAGGGTEVLSALVHGARHVTAVEVDPGVVELMTGPLSGYSGDLYGRPDVELVVADGRGFLRSRPEARFDLIQLALIDAFSTSSAGVHALSESYLYTVEALELYLSRLSDEGVLSITRWLQSPPRDAIKLFATTVTAARRAGLGDPAVHVAFIRSWNTGTIVVSRRALAAPQLSAIREFARARSFDLAWLTGLRESEVNRYTVLESPVYHEAARRILSEDSERFFEEYPFYVRPATDDRPYFFRFFRWRSLPLLLGQTGRDWLNFVEWGYIVLIATLAQSGLAALALVLLPLLVFGRRSSERPPTGALAVYFGSLGLGYMLLEIAFIQKLVLFLGHPIYAVGVVLAGFLVFSGLGSLYADGEPTSGTRRVRRVVAGLAGLSVLYLIALPPLLEAWSGWRDPARIAASLAILSPLAFLMGIPFPTGLQAICRGGSAGVPWAWGVNGAASVVGATLATLIAVHAGFRVLVLLAVALYALAALSVASLSSR